ncbi:MAG TPA: VWA domain-containing protein [Candidatus Krumholzibacteria bacterium]|nr:VWA domain-containing protein [Candidatus Krumholzibacteria bacterium]
MPNQHRLNVIAKLDRRLVSTRGGTRHILLDLAAPKEPRPEADQRPPLNLALVIDASGSMDGGPLDAAKAAAAGLIDQMTARDRITLVTFADDIIVHADALAADAAGCARLAAEVNGLVTRGCTNLAGGWLEGADRVRRAMADLGVAQNRVIVLSDGHANRGICDPETLALKAAALRTAGVYTSCVGIGDGYSPVQLEAIAEHGGGRMHDAPLGEDIIATVMGELGEILGTFADNLTVTVAHPRLLPLALLGPYPKHVDDGRLVVHAGTLVSGARRRVVLQAVVPAGQVGDRFPVVIEVTWRDAEGLPNAAKPVLVELALAPAVEVAAELPDLDTCRTVAEMWHRHVLHASTLLNAEGRCDEARALVDEHLPRFADYCRDLPGTAHLVQDLESHGQVVFRPMAPGHSKGIAMSAFMDLRSETDYRRNRRGR